MKLGYAGIVTCKFEERKSKIGKGGAEEGGDRTGRREILSFPLQVILGGKPLGNLLISFNAIFRKIYAGPGEARLVEKVGRGQRASDGRGRDEFPEREGCW